MPASVAALPTEATATTRIVGFDVARVFAVVGMVLVNFTLVMGVMSDGPRWLRLMIEALQGRAVATFVVLAGAGMSLMARRALASRDPVQLSAVKGALFRRAAFLFCFGLAFVPVWPADILRFYGLYIALGTLLLAAPNRRLWGVSGGLAALFVVLTVVIDYEAGWNFVTLEYHGFWTPVGFVRHLLFNGYHPLIPWASLLLVGIWLGRRDVHDARTRRRLFVGAAFVALAAHAASKLLIRRLSTLQSHDELEDLAALLGTEMIPPGPLYLLAGGGAAVAFIVACVHWGLRPGARVPLTHLARAGQLALTLYVAHVVVGLGGLAAIGRLEDQSLPFAVAAALAFSGAGIAAASWWRARHARGPLEALERWLTSTESRSLPRKSGRSSRRMV